MARDLIADQCFQQETAVSACTAGLKPVAFGCRRIKLEAFRGKTMKSTSSSSGRRTPAIALAFLAVTLTFVWFGVSGNAALAQPSTAAGMRGAAEAQQTPKGTAQAAKITKDDASKIALKAVPGKVTDVAMEKKLGKQVYVVEILAQADGVETDVFVDIATGEVVGTEQ